MEAATNGAQGKQQERLLYAATIQFKATPFRSERFALGFLEGLPRSRDFGAKSYSFIRSDQDKEIFYFISYWENKKDFEQWWFSTDMQKVRQNVQGITELHGYPSWHTVLEQHGLDC